MSPALDLIHSRPGDPAHSEYQGIVRRVTEVQCTKILTTKTIKEITKIFRTFPAAIRNYQVPTDQQELGRFLFMLPFMRTNIPGRADLSTVMRKAIIVRTTEFQQGQIKRKNTECSGCRMGPEQQKAFEETKSAICNTVLTGGNENLQYHPVTSSGWGRIQSPFLRPSLHLSRDPWVRTEAKRGGDLFSPLFLFLASSAFLLFGPAWYIPPALLNR